MPRRSASRSWPGRSGHIGLDTLVRDLRLIGWGLAAILLVERLSVAFNTGGWAPRVPAWRADGQRPPAPGGAPGRRRVNYLTPSATVGGELLRVRLLGADVPLEPPLGLGERRQARPVGGPGRLRPARARARRCRDSPRTSRWLGWLGGGRRRRGRRGGARGPAAFVWPSAAVLGDALADVLARLRLGGAPAVVVGRPRPGARRGARPAGPAAARRVARLLRRSAGRWARPRST